MAKSEKKARKLTSKLEKAIAKQSPKKINNASSALSNVLNTLPAEFQQGLLASAPPAISGLLGARGLLTQPQAAPVFNPTLTQQLGLLSAPPQQQPDPSAAINQFVSSLLQQPVSLGSITSRLFTPRAGAGFIGPNQFGGGQ